MFQLFSIKPIAKAITQLPFWIPQVPDGRLFEQHTILGPVFSLSILPNPGSPVQVLLVTDMVCNFAVLVVVMQ